MKRALLALVAGTIISGICAWSASGQTAVPTVSLTRLACGATKEPRDVAAFSDTNAWDGVKKSLVASCYLIRHGDDLMLWDAGYAASVRTDPNSIIALPATIVEQLRQLGVDPAKVSRVGISHYHSDHIGQANDFPGATLMIGAGDWAAISATPAAPGTDPTLVAPWIAGTSKVDPVRGDLDVFGDKSVVMLDLPGHTPGHHGLLVRLKGKTVLLTGDLSHFTDNYTSDGIPAFNTNRADTLASIHRFKKIAENLKATVIIQHEPADIAKLPAFPAAAQ